jgi:predicted secreted protein
LLAVDGPVSFIDALALTRALSSYDPPDPTVAALIALHDAAHVTDGARQILASYLRQLAKRREQERRRCERPVTLADDAQTGRLRRGATLTLALDERRGAGFRWRLAGMTPAPACVTVQRLSPDPESASPGLAGEPIPPVAVFSAQAVRSGMTQLRFIEEGPPGGPAKERAFEFRLVVEPSLELP